ncbi:MAG: hypothetical protein PHC85_01825 [Candidatus Pacebacteria bacterium]|nr:hypothetical protein [Candidatus Paceibacterota bacterium]
MRKNTKVVDPRFSKGKGDYEKVIFSIEKEGKCPFCPDNFRYHKHPVLKRRGDWFITKSSWPYLNARLHLVLIKNSHKESVRELNVNDMKDILFLVKWASGEFKISGGGLAMRFGKTAHTGATVCHIHAHLIVPKRRKSVSFPIG